MNTNILNALQHLAELKAIAIGFKLDDYAASYDIILDNMYSLNKHELKSVLSNMLTILNNENAGLVFMNQIPIDMIGIIAEESLLPISDLTSLFAELSNYFLNKAQNWIGEVYYSGYILYAVRLDYSIEAIKEGLLMTSESDNKYFYKVLKEIYEPNDSWVEGAEKIKSITTFLEDNIIC